MAGCFTHIMVAKKLVEESRNFNSGQLLGLSRIMRKWSNYVMLGAVSPDMPYLALASEWADKFHYVKTAEIIRRGIRGLFNKSFDDVADQKCLAWLLGYASHVVTDLYIHPIIEKCVGPYAKNKRAHRKCEMSQDVFIVKHKLGLTLCKCELLDHTIKTCTETGEEAGFAGIPGLDPVIVNFWTGLLTAVYGKDPAPSPDRWFIRFSAAIDKFSENSRKFPFVTRTILSKGVGLVYPTTPKKSFVEGLVQPLGNAKNFDKIFDADVAKVVEIVKEIQSAIRSSDDSLFTLPDGNLDTGMRLDDISKSIFWA